MINKINEKIISITETDFKIEGSWPEYSGFIIETDSQTIKMGISNFQSCCENWGYLMTNDNIQDFVGATLHSISETDLLLNVTELDELRYMHEGAKMFINFETSEGTLQFVAYNAHNGYYGHSCVLLSKQLNIQDVL